MRQPQEPRLVGPQDDTLTQTSLGPQIDASIAEGDTHSVVTPGDNQSAVEAVHEGRLGRFVILRLLGMGGMGVVYSAYDELLARRVALKLVRTDRHDSDAHSRILHEAKALARLSHPNVVQIYEVSASAGRVFIAMEHVEGCTLRDWTAARRSRGPTPLRDADRREVLNMYIQAGRGLAAAHAGGLVHRDFKPDNVLVGDDGRARVVDFGLVTARGLSGPVLASAGRGGPAGPTAPRLTDDGAVLGTPAYMPPEQFDGRPADARSDQFSFCAALYEALVGARPFAGESFAELQRSVGAGSLLPPPPGAVPEWLQAILRVGLATRPEDRFPAMDDLLAALARDPVAIRRRRLRIAALALGSALLALLLVFLFVSLRQRELERSRELAADRALASAEALIAEARAASDPSAAAVFTHFVADPLHDGTVALGRAWLAEAERRRDDGDPATARAAFAAAYAHAQTPEQQRSALTGLARLFRDGLEWAALTHLFDLLDRHHPDAASDPELALLRIDTALARREFATVRAQRTGHPAAVAVADALVGATATPHRDIQQAHVGERHVLLLEDRMGRRAVHVAARAPGMPLLHSLPLSRDTTWTSAVTDDPTLVIAHMDGEHNTLYRADPDGIVAVHRWDGPGPSAAAAADLDGDGVRELYVATGTDLEVVELIPTATGPWITRTVYTASEALESAVHVLRPIDLDGDGRQELAAGLQGWRAYDVRVLARDRGAAALKTIARDKLGTVVGLAGLRRDRQVPLLVATNMHHAAGTLVFPPDHPSGEAEGLHVYTLDDGRLTRRGHLPLPLPHAASFAGTRAVGDVDGDGRDDLGTSFGTAHDFHTLLHLQSASGELAPVILGHLEFLTFAQLDDDRADELIANVIDPDGVSRVHVLGVGDDELAPVAAATITTATLTDPDDDAWTRQWDQAAALQGLGLLADAAAAYQDLGRRTAKLALRAAAYLHAASLREHVGDARAALPLFKEAALAPALAPAALQGALRTQLRLGEYEEARKSLADLLALVDLPDDVRDELTRRWTPLIAVVDERVDLDFSQPLAPAWSLPQPLALRRAPGTRTLEIDTTAPGVLASLPVEWFGEMLEMSAELTVDETEWSTQLEISLVPEDPTLEGVAALKVGTGGTSRGGVTVHRGIHCNLGRHSLIDRSQRDPFSRTDVAVRVTMRVSVIPALGEASCEIHEQNTDTHQNHHEPLLRPLPAGGRYRLVVRVRNDDPAHVSAQLHRLTLLGARLVDGPQDPLRAALHGALVDGDPVLAIAALDRLGALTPAEQTWRAHALLQRGRLAEARALWRPLLAAPALEPTLQSLLRAHPTTYGPLLRELDPDRYPELLAELWRNAALNHLDDRRTQLALYAALGPLDAEELVGAAAADPAALARACDLLSWRGRLFARTREPARARLDLQRALAVAGRLPADTPQHAQRWLLWLDLASLAAVAGDGEQAREAVLEARASSDTLLLGDVIRARPELAGL